MKVAIGDSFAYGEELEDRSKAWPGLIGYENHGLRGASNEYTFRRAVELALQATHMIVAWSDSGRYELYTQRPITVSECYNHHKGVIQVNPGWVQMGTWFKELYSYYSDEEHQLLRTLSYMVALQDVLKANNIDYWFCSAFGNQQLFKKYIDNSKLKPWFDRLNTDKFIGYPSEGFVEWAYDAPRGLNGHPLKEGHKLIADEILKHI